MKNFIKKFMCLSLALGLVFISCAAEESAVQVDNDVSAQLISAKSGILMEQSTGEVLYEMNPDERLQIASVTKTMTMLLIMEAIDSGKISLDDMVTTSEYAASMGGSQVFLEVGEQMSVDDMLKAIAVASGNDAAVAMAEFVSGSESAFVEKMNERAAELGCINTHFINCNGLDETDEHYSTAKDIAIISRELLKHSKIFDYTTIWMDSLRGGSFGLSNTNKLIRFYKGANGLKTGSTSVAKYCLSATAERDGMQLIAVVLAAPSSAERFGSASKLLDYGFANYALVSPEITENAVPVKLGKADFVKAVPAEPIQILVDKAQKNQVQIQTVLEEQVSAPVSKGQKLGTLTIKVGEQTIKQVPLVAETGVERLTWVDLFWMVLRKIAMAKG